MRSKGLLWATVGLAVVVGLLVQRSYSLNVPREVSNDPQRDAAPASTLQFQPVDSESYALGMQTAKTAARTYGYAGKTPKDWTSYWLGFADESRVKTTHGPATSRLPDALHDDQRCVQGEVLVIKDSSYAKAKRASGATYLCSGETVLPVSR